MIDNTLIQFLRDFSADGKRLFRYPPGDRHNKPLPIKSDAHPLNERSNSTPWRGSPSAPLKIPGCRLSQGTVNQARRIVTTLALGIPSRST